MTSNDSTLSCAAIRSIAFAGTLTPWTTGAVYVDAIGGDVTDARKLAAYGGQAKYDRLRVLKRLWDPGNLFHLNHNIAP